MKRLTVTIFALMIGLLTSQRSWAPTYPVSLSGDGTAPTCADGVGQGRAPNMDSDGDNLHDAFEDANGNCNFTGEVESNPDNADSDGDGITDFFEVWTDINSYVELYGGQSGPFRFDPNDENYFVTDDLGTRVVKRGNRCPYTLMDGDARTWPWDCDGDGTHNAFDLDSDGDGTNDAVERCDGNFNNPLPGPGVWHDSCVRAGRLPYLWETTDPYSWDTDGDRIPDGPMTLVVTERTEWGEIISAHRPLPNEAGDQVEADLCPRERGGDHQNGTSYECVRRLCRQDKGIMGLVKQSHSTWDTDHDGRPDVQEDYDESGGTGAATGLNCVVDRDDPNNPNAIGSRESDPFYAHSDAWDPAIRNYPGRQQEKDARRAGTATAPTEYPWGLGDRLQDGDDPCPLDPNACPYICIPFRGGWDAGQQSSVDRARLDSDEDGIVDGGPNGEDKNDDCRYLSPLPGEIAIETDWKNPDSDGDIAAGYGANDPRRFGIGKDGVDKCPHIKPYDLMSDEERAAIPEEEVYRTTYPGCLYEYCVSSLEGLPERFHYTMAGHPNDDPDLDDILNKDEDVNGNCRADGGFETDPFHLDTDRDDLEDKLDPCPDQPGVLVCPELCPQQQPNHRFWNRDSDLDALFNYQEDVNKDCIVDRYESDVWNSNTDGDDVGDFQDSCAWNPEPCLKICDPRIPHGDKVDSDGDGMKDNEEDTNQLCIFFGEKANSNTELEPFDTNPFKRDTDCDGISDLFDGCQEAGLCADEGSSGLMPDLSVPVTDDEMACAREQCRQAVGRKPALFKDSDRDLLSDGIEDRDINCEVTVGAGGSTVETDRFNPDTDFDGLLDGCEDRNLNGIVDKGETDPRNTDSDHDGIPDGLMDLNGDGFPEGEDRNLNCRLDFGELDPTKEDTDGDAILDTIEDRNGDGIWQGGQTRTAGPGRIVDEEGKPVINRDQAGLEIAPETSGYIADSDRDGIPDGLEDFNKDGTFTSLGCSIDPVTGKLNVDFNNITQLGEYCPLNVDTDSDGLNEIQEDMNGNGRFEPLLGELSAISQNTFGEGDFSRSQRKIGQKGGCSLIIE